VIYLKKMLFHSSARQCRKERILKLMDNFTFEVTPASAKKVDSFKVWKGRKANITFLPGSDVQDTISTVERLQSDGIQSIPHIATRSFKDFEMLENYIKRITELGVKDVFVVGGGVDKPLGNLTESLQVLESGLLEKYGIETVGIAAHPEGSPDIKPDVLKEAMEKKLNWALKSKMKCYWCTQLSFDPKTYHNLKPYNELPLHIGMAGPASLPSLIKFATYSGVGNSLNFLTKYTSNAFKLLKHTPADLIEELSVMKEELNIEAVHIYCFGGVKSTVEWAEKVEKGQFKLDDPVGFTVE